MLFGKQYWFSRVSYAQPLETSNYFQLSLLLLLSSLTHFQNALVRSIHTLAHTHTQARALCVSYLHKCSELTLWLTCGRRACTQWGTKVDSSKWAVRKVVEKWKGSALFGYLVCAASASPTTVTPTLTPVGRLARLLVGGFWGLAVAFCLPLK